MAAGDLVQDPQPNLTASAQRKISGSREYELAFPLRNDSLGNTAWERDRSYQIAVLVGPTKQFRGVTEDTWMSDQVLIRIRSRSTVSIYDPPLAEASPAPQRQEGPHRH
jgi:hypothetical protein